LNARHSVQRVVNLVIDLDVANAAEDGMRGNDSLQLGGQNQVFALRAAAGSTEQFELALDVFRVFRADAPVQCRDGPATRG